MKNKYVLMTLALVVFVVGYFLYQRLGRLEDSSPPPLIEQVKQGDIVRMTSDAPLAEKAKSLKRMAAQNPEKAKEFARQLIESDEVELRAAAYEAAAIFSGEEWDNLVKRGLADNELEVRLGTLKGASRQPGQVRAGYVSDFLQQGGASPVEKIWANLLLLRSNPQDLGRERYESTIFANLKKLDGRYLGETLVELYKLWPAQAELVSFAEKIVGSGKESQELMPSFRYLASSAKPQLALVLAKSPWPDSRSFVLQVVDFLIGFCPKDMAVIESKIANHPKADDEIKARLSSVQSCTEGL